jgi:hypothetical protein
MSAFIVSDYHINALVTWAANRHAFNAVTYYWAGRSRDVRSDPQRIANVLYAENVRSVNARYDDAEPAHGFNYVGTGRTGLSAYRLSPVQIIKACHCLAYQSCETSDWEDTEAFAILRGIEDAAVRSLAGYDEADWCLEEPTREAA